MASAGPLATRIAVRTVVAAGAVTLAKGCAAPLPARAAELEVTECRDEPPPAEEQRELEAAMVLSASPALVAHSCSGTNRVTAVKLVVRPPEHFDADGFARLLRCHHLRVLDGQVNSTSIASDPYGLTDSWLEVDVRPADGGNLLVTLNGDRIRDNLDILHRAKARAGGGRREKGTPQ